MQPYFVYTYVYRENHVLYKKKKEKYLKQIHAFNVNVRLYIPSRINNLYNVYNT